MKGIHVLAVEGIPARRAGQRNRAQNSSLCWKASDHDWSRRARLHPTRRDPLHLCWTALTAAKLPPDLKPPATSCQIFLASCAIACPRPCSNCWCRGFLNCSPWYPKEGRGFYSPHAPFHISFRKEPCVSPCFLLQSEARATTVGPRYLLIIVNGPASEDSYSII